MVCSASQSQQVSAPGVLEGREASGEAVPGLMTWVDAGTGDVFWEMEWDLLGRFEMYQRGIREADDDRG